MPVALSYPGVYIEEVPSGVRTITGVATSITAFVGRAMRGRVDQPVRIFSFADYERAWADSTMSFAVNQYFQNGGSDAIVVRIHKNALTGNAALPLSGGGTATFTAANPGGWAARLRIRVDLDLDSDIVASNPANTMFNLRVKDLDTGAVEAHRNLSIAGTHPRFATAVLEQASKLLRGPANIAAEPTANGAPAATATDPFDDPSSTSVTVGANADGGSVTANELDVLQQVAGCPARDHDGLRKQPGLDHPPQRRPGDAQYPQHILRSHELHLSPPATTWSNSNAG